MEVLTKEQRASVLNSIYADGIKSREDDIGLAYRYIAKAFNAGEKGHEFTISFAEYKRLHKKKHCHYTGLEFSKYEDGKPVSDSLMRTLDRVDSSKGYVPGNVVACIKAVNQLKGKVEAAHSPLDFDILFTLATNIKETYDKVKDNA